MKQNVVAAIAFISRYDSQVFYFFLDATLDGHLNKYHKEKFK